jgi:regulator of protease activity HflC (stomatin/prohibitin superfamily)
MVQSLSVLVNSALADAQEDQELAVDDIRKLARATKDAIQARSASLKERQAIESAAREKLLAEQKEKLAAMPSKGGVTEETKQAIREALGIS